MFTFSYFQFIPKCQKLWHLKNQSFLLLHTACISLALPLSLFLFTRDTDIVCLQWNVSQCVQIWIFNISNTDSFTQTIYLWYKYYSKWICVSFSFQYITEPWSNSHIFRFCLCNIAPPLETRPHSHIMFIMLIHVFDISSVLFHVVE